MKSLSRVPGQAGPRAGRIGFFDAATRKIQYAQFSTVDDPEAFFEALRTEHEGLEFTVKKRAAKTILEGEFRRGLFSVPYHVVYEDGLALFGSTAAVSSVNSAKIRTLMQDSSRDERTIQFRFTAVPGSFREELFGEVRRASATFLQQRNTETANGYGARRALADLKLELLRMAADDIDELQFRTRWPGPKQGGFDANIKIQCVKGSELHKLLRELVVKHPAISVADPEQLAGWAELHLGVPNRIRKLLMSLSGNSSLPGQLLHTASQGRCELALGIDASEAVPHFFGASGFVGDKLPLEGMPKPCTSDAGFRWKLDSVSGYSEVAGLELLAAVEKKRIWFDVSTAPAQAAFRRFNFETKRTPTSILAFRFDFSKWQGRFDEGAPSQDVLRALEDLCDSVYLAKRLQQQKQNLAKIRAHLLESTKRLDPSVRERILQAGLDSHRNSSTFRLPDGYSEPSQSILQHTDREGDWTATGEVRLANGALEGKLHVGRELHKLYVARRLLAAKRIMVFRGQEPKPNGDK
jgi:hypothetical protein